MDNLKYDNAVMNYLTEGSVTAYREYKMLSEEAKSEKADRVVTKLFRDIKGKAFKCDFSIMDRSEGRITKCQCYDTLKNALKFINQLSNDAKCSKEVKEAVFTLNNALKNLEKYENDFNKTYKNKNLMLKYLYSSMGIALVHGTSLLVATCIEFVKNPNGVTKGKFNGEAKLPKNHNLNALYQFNEMCSSSQLPKIFSKMNKTPVQESAIGIGAAIKTAIVAGGASGTLLTISGIIGGILLAIFTIREVVFAYYYIRVSLSAYLEQLSDFIMMNQVGIEDSKTKEKQENIAKKLRSLSERIAVDQKVANNRGESDKAKSDKEAKEEANKTDSTSTSTSSSSSDDDGLGGIL